MTTMSLPLTLVFVAMATVTMTSSSRILLIPVPHYSHVNMFAVAAETLNKGGHDVAIMVHDVHARRVEKMNATVLKYPLSKRATLATVFPNLLKDVADMDENILSKGLYFYKHVTVTIDKFCREVLGNDEIMDALRYTKYDLAIVDSDHFLSCLHYIPYKFDIPRVNLGPFVSPWTYGVYSMPFHEPPAVMEVRSTQLSLPLRVLSTLTALFTGNMPTFLGYNGYTYTKTFLPERPAKSVSELMNEGEITLITVETTCFDFPKLSAPHYRFIGSLSATVAPKTLPDYFKIFADNAKYGLIIVSFGSMVDLRKHIIGSPIHMLIDALGRMKEKAILQFNQTELCDLKIPSNILVTPWLPQLDLLAHPNTKLFISHGGLNSHLEATHLGVPILTLPFHLEQANNGARAEARGYGKILKWDETNAEEIYNKSREVIDDKSYKRNIMKCSQIIKDLPSAREQLSFWVNHVLKHGSKHLRPLSADMSFSQFFGLDVFAVIFSALMIVLLVFCVCCRFCISTILQSSKQKQD